MKIRHYRFGREYSCSLIWHDAQLQFYGGRRAWWIRYMHLPPADPFIVLEIAWYNEAFGKAGANSLAFFSDLPGFQDPCL